MTRSNNKTLNYLQKTGDREPSLMYILVNKGRTQGERQTWRELGTAGWGNKRTPE